MVRLLDPAKPLKKSVEGATESAVIVNERFSVCEVAPGEVIAIVPLFAPILTPVPFVATSIHRFAPLLAAIDP